MNIEMISIQGFDEAILGTGIRESNREVLVYDADKCEELLITQGYGVNSLSHFLESIDVDSLGNRAPLFIYLDANVDYDATDERGRPALRIVH